MQLNPSWITSHKDPHIRKFLVSRTIICNIAGKHENGESWESLAMMPAMQVRRSTFGFNQNFAELGTRHFKFLDGHGLPGLP